ncbi:MAG: sigma-70 family RNA polymerase sigma factor [Planctomycetes bacterium]|nr:sigma-70 family RNA polymerase sigma factor [Planctomycetota bacterium]
MTDPKEPPRPEGSEPPPLSSTLRYVQSVQGDGGPADTDVSWTNLHEKCQRWVAEAAHGQNLPADRSLDDLSQEVMLQVFRDIGSFQVEPGASFSGWVRTITQRKLHDYWRRARAQKRGGGKTKHLGDLDESGGRDRFEDERVERQSMLVRFRELQDGLQHALAELSERHKRVLELRLFQGKSYAEIMPVLGYDKEVTVRSLHMRALQRLQELLGAHG